MLPENEVTKIDIEICENQQDGPIPNEEIFNENGIPDGGWGWIVLVAALFVRVTIAGVYATFALFTKDFTKEYNISPSLMSWMIAVYSAAALLVAPVASFLAMKFGYRFMSIVGLIIASVTYPSTYFYSPLWYTFLTSSVIVAVAQGITNMCVNVILTHYFDKRLSIAMGVYSCGVGVASFVVTPLMTFLINTFGWKMSKVIFSLMYIFAIACAATFKPIKRKENLKSKESNNPESKPSKDSNISNYISMANITSKMSMNENTKYLDKPLRAVEFDKKMIDETSTSVANIPIETLIGMSVASNLQLKTAVKEMKTENLEVVVSTEPATPAIGTNPQSRGYLELLKNPIFIIFLISNFLSNLGNDTPYIFTKGKALESGATETQATLLLTLIGLGNVIGRLGFGFLGSRKQFNTYLLYIVCLITSGSFIIMSRVAFTFPLMVTYVLGFSVFIGGFVTLGPVLLIKILDIADFSNGLSILFVIQAIGLFAGAPISGIIYDATKSYNWPFLSCGIIILSSGLILIASYFSKDFRDRQKNN